MELNNATVQDIQLELIRRSKWNSFNGQRIFDDLQNHRDLWEAVMLDTREQLKLLKLRDLNTNRWHTDTLYILAGDEESARKLVDLCWQWNADEAQYHNAKITSDRLHRGLLKNHCLVEAWWD
jgi:hypothetical protein